MKKLIPVLLLLSAVAFAQGTRGWQQSTFDDFEKGTAKGVAIRSQGGLELAPAFTLLYTTPSTYVWAAAGDAKGNVYLAAGSPARVYKVTPDGASTVLFAPKELQVQALVADRNGVLYAGTSPDGKVYRIEPVAAGKKKATEKGDEASETPRSGEVALDPGYTSSVYFEPKTKYIWDLALAPDGALYVATGDRGEIFRVSPKGEGTPFFKSDEAHIRVLALDAKGNLIAGSDGSGLIYRISPAGEAFVLYSAPKKEITALALDKDGNIYAAAAGEKRSGGATMPMTPAATAGGFTFSTTATANPGQQPPPGAQPQPGAPPVGPMPMPLPMFGAVTGSEVYQLAPDGSPRRLWSSREDLVYALAFDGRGRLLAGTGNKGRIYAIERNGDFTDLLKASASQVSSFARAPEGGLYAATSNLGKVFALGSAPAGEGAYESDVFDARIFSRWGRAEFRGAGNVELYARSGNVDNPDRNWSPWQRIDLARDGALDVPPARFIQWKAVLRPSNDAPRVESVTLNYRSKNVAPVVEEVAVQPGARFQAAARPASPMGGDDSGPIQVGGPAQPQMQAARPDFAPPAFRDPDYVAMRWQARDDNDDELTYAIYYRGDGETNWKLLKEDIREKYYSTEAALFPDGGYALKVVASDAPSHSPDDVLADEKESARFEIDTTPPVLSDLAARRDGEALHVVFRAADSFSPIRRAEYSVDAGEWRLVEPVGQLSDSKTENYDFSVPVPAPPADAAAKKARADAAEHIVVVRVYDRYGNMATAKTVVRGK